MNIAVCIVNDIFYTIQWVYSLVMQQVEGPLYFMTKCPHSAFHYTNYIITEEEIYSQQAAYNEGAGHSTRGYTAHTPGEENLM